MRQHCNALAYCVQGLWAGLMTLCSLLLLLPPCHFTHVWHMASEQFNAANDYSPVWEAYRVSSNHQASACAAASSVTVKGCPSLCSQLSGTAMLTWLLLSALPKLCRRQAALQAHSCQQSMFARAVFRRRASQSPQQCPLTSGSSCLLFAWAMCWS